MGILLIVSSRKIALQIQCRDFSIYFCHLDALQNAPSILLLLPHFRVHAQLVCLAFFFVKQESCYLTVSNEFVKSNLEEKRLWVSSNNKI